MHHLLDYLNFL